MNRIPRAAQHSHWSEGVGAPEPAHCGFAVLRTALLPFDDLIKWGEREASDSIGAPAEGVTDAKNALLGLREFVSEPAFEAAIRIASPALHQSLSDWLRGRPVSDVGRLEQSLIRYFSRAAFRTTPFGLFAGCSLLPIGDQTTLQLCSRAEYRQHSRIDMEHLAEIARTVSADHEVRPALSLVRNSSAVVVGARIHFVEGQYNGRLREYSLTAVDATHEVKEVLAAAEKSIPFHALQQTLIRLGYTPDETAAFLNELVDIQLLIPCLEPQLTGDDAAAVLAADIAALGLKAEVRETLETVRSGLSQWDSSGVAGPLCLLDAALQPLHHLDAAVDPERVLQVDLFKPAHKLVLGTSIARDLAEGAELLQGMMIQVDPLAAFVAQFEQRYETQEVPLLEALDDEIGIGLPSVDADDAVMRRHSEQMRQREAVLADLRERAARNGASVVSLTADDIARLRPASPLPSPDAFAVAATVVARSTDEVEAGNYELVMHLVSGPSGARLLGRFTHLFPEFAERVRKHLEMEEALHPTAIFAEVVHLPQGRVGNIVSRPRLRRYEIPYLGRSSAAPSCQIPPSDLRVSLRGGRLVLRSETLDREIRPRLSCAHNYLSTQQLPVYRFLAMLQDHGLVAYASWSWGPLVAARCLPRVTHGRFVLARASWRIAKDDLPYLARERGDARYAAFQRWRTAQSAPRFLQLVDGENRWPIDSDNPKSVEAFLQLIRERDAAIVEEMLPAPDQLCVRGPEGCFTHEIVVPFVRPAPRPTSDTQFDIGVDLRRAARTITRRHAPGVEWVYAKLYCGKGNADYVLRNVVAPLAMRLADTSVIDRWFFIRYADPQFHIRLRFHARADAAVDVLRDVSRVCASAMDESCISRLVFDTYMPEVERYGGAVGIALAEKVFHADSVAAIRLLIQSGHPGNRALVEDRDLAILAGIDRYFADAGIELSRRLALLTPKANAPVDVRRERSAEFRGRRSAIADVISHARGSGQSEFVEALNSRSDCAATVLAELAALDRGRCLTRSLDDILFSLTHMWTIRMTSDAARIEPTAYDFLCRHYRSELARLEEPLPHSNRASSASSNETQ